MTGWCVLDCPFYLSQQQIFQLSHLIISSLFLHFHLKKLSRSRPHHLKMCTMDYLMHTRLVQSPLHPYPPVSVLQILGSSVHCSPLLAMSSFPCFWYFLTQLLNQKKISGMIMSSATMMRMKAIILGYLEGALSNLVTRSVIGWNASRTKCSS